ncbi:radical SAM family heme chaperone HemW [OM182 bacterium]|nr:radical SAM family heme chaperone HemW [OM182 bacterium]
MAYPPLTLYVHIPWCEKKCPYCDFNSHKKIGSIPEADYIKALCNDFDRDFGIANRVSAKSSQSIADPRQINSIFIGGGTPSLFDPLSIKILLEHIKTRTNHDPNIEITLEANPGTAEAAKFDGYREAGVNRLSIGVQSFDDIKLKMLGRLHTGRQSYNAITLAKQAGFKNYNIDIMHTLPGQTVKDGLRDLHTALSFKPPHLSWYELTIERNTVFYSFPPPLPNETIAQELYELGNKNLEAGGLRQYEISAYSTKDKPSSHNLNYWQFGDYLGIGAGSHGKISYSDGEIYRLTKKRQPDGYLNDYSDRLNSMEINPNFTLIENDQISIEFLLNNLRLREGFTIELFEQRTNLSFSKISDKVDQMISKGLLRSAGNQVTTTEIGFHMIDTILGEFS